MIKDKNVLLGVTGGIAAYKAASLASLLVKAGAAVNVIMTKEAQNFIGAATFEALTHRRVHDDVFDRADPSRVHHIALAQEADLLVIAPATAARRGAGDEHPHVRKRSHTGQSRCSARPRLVCDGAGRRAAGLR